MIFKRLIDPLQILFAHFIGNLFVRLLQDMDNIPAIKALHPFEEANRRRGGRFNSRDRRKSPQQQNEKAT